LALDQKVRTVTTDQGVKFGLQFCRPSDSHVRLPVAFIRGDSFPKLNTFNQEANCQSLWWLVRTGCAECGYCIICYMIRRSSFAWWCTVQPTCLAHLAYLR